MHYQIFGATKFAWPATNRAHRVDQTCDRAALHVLSGEVGNHKNLMSLDADT